ncbi:hybrid sensor histidine kinase/response regulator [Aphanothece hegewaldii CCALA 016]|uniref:histidine kinase n=1 Tax=Aphanothece hegewaldii CCALA 016 TaxID=2107694 RepID=A0A2T1LZS8_9CHRO|nr:hybrid sensor histidine kinase/response regulator [Aphanothece hegewaldii]PSF37870.1 hybrid sensor histidine kinase/response regulator [Aphanothece hegewaldii CCALA 016]
MLKKNILIVDDQADNLRLLDLILTKSGYKVRKALNGKTAINTVKITSPDLILLDIKMPEMNGYEVCQFLKADENTKDIPIIFISALNDVLDKVKAFKVGGLDYITKPFQEEEVIARVENQLTIRWQKKQLEKEIEQRQKTEERLRFYLHAVSHDLRNPVIGLTMILNNLLESPTITEKSLNISLSRSILEQMKNSCDRQLKLINLLVETQQYSLWEMSLKCEPINLYSLTQEIITEWLPILEENQAILINNISPDCPLIKADPHQIWRVYENLLSNAIKYNTTGLEITLNAEIIENKLINQPSMMRCLVSDNGVGMNIEQAKNLFTPYYRGENTQRDIGLGLGLYLCHQIIQAHGGTIEVITQPQKGTQFCFTLPLSN